MPHTALRFRFHTYTHQSYDFYVVISPISERYRDLSLVSSTYDHVILCRGYPVAHIHRICSETTRNL